MSLLLKVLRRKLLVLLDWCRCRLVGMLEICEPVLAIIRPLFGHSVNGLGRETAVILARVDFDSWCVGKAGVQVRVHGIFWPREKLDLDNGAFST